MGGEPIRIIEADTGRLLGMADGGAAAGSVHPGAVYLHQGESYLVRELDLDAAIALVEAKDPGYATYAREVAQVRIVHGGAVARSGTPTAASPAARSP